LRATGPPLDADELARRNERVRRAWRREADRYDKTIGFFERRVFGTEHRRWACAQATGSTLEVAVGTGLNLAHYPKTAAVTGIDLSPEMLAIAARRAAELGRDVDLREGDAHSLPFGDASFDTCVCTYGLCNIPDDRRAILEMKRVLRPGGRLILVDHVRSSVAPIRWLQRAIELVSARVEGEHLTRRPAEHVAAAGFEVVERTRSRAGILERIVALR
jgi:ubiquinone/menaquinone biosynthesis C-methylase UbiE